MESVVIENIPYDALAIMGSLFEKGNIVNSYRLIANIHGFSITLQLCQPKTERSALTENSPLTTPSAKRSYKSPSAINRDKTRMNSFISDHESIQQVAVEPNETDTYLENGINSDMASERHDESQEIDQSVEDNRANHSECAPGTNDEPKEEPCTEQGNVGESDMVKDKPVTAISNEGGTHDSNVTCDTEHAKAHDDAVRAQADIVHDTENKIGNTEAQYRKNIRNKQRNLTFDKIVHDTRNEGSVVYGMTDDLIILVDEKNCKYSTWAKHDKDKKCDEILELLQKWPPASHKRCKYGVDTLHTLLPDIVQSEQKPE